MCMSNLAGAAHRIRGLGTRSDRTNAERVSEAPTSVVLNASPCTQAYKPVTGLGLGGPARRRSTEVARGAARTF